MTPRQAEKEIRLILKEFDDFSSDLINQDSGKFSSYLSSYNSYKGDIITYLHNFFTTYLDEVKKLKCLDYVNLSIREMVQSFRDKHGIEEKSPSFDLENEIEKVCEMLLECLQRYFKGFPSDAYMAMEKAMTDGHCHLMNLLPQLHLAKGSFEMYRVRKGTFKEAKELFHVPFEKREQCDSYRYSILGVPALYCSASLQTALLETSISVGEKYTAAIFEFKENVDVAFIDLTLPAREDYGLWERYSLILYYPLIVSCGLKVRNEEKPFRPEYVIPQLFYQLMRQHSNNFCGIIFNSCKYHNRNITDYKQNNYVVFTTQCDQESGYCEALASRLKVRGPINIENLNTPEIENVASKLRKMSSHDIRFN